MIFRTEKNMFNIIKYVDSGILSVLIGHIAFLAYKEISAYSVGTTCSCVPGKIMALGIEQIEIIFK